MEFIEELFLREIKKGEKINLKILAMSQMYHGVCIAGVDEKNEWIRPIKAKPADNFLFDANLRFEYPDDFKNFPLKNVDKYKEKTFIFKGKAGTTPHSEDNILYYPDRTLFKSLKKDKRNNIMKELNFQAHEISEKCCIKLLEILDESDLLRRSHQRPETYLRNNNRSLMLLAPDDILDCKWAKGDDTEYKPRIIFMVNGMTMDYRCTDLQWMTLGKDGIERAAQYLQHNQKNYFVIGLSRKTEKNRITPLIVGVHTIPLYFKGLEINYSVLQKASNKKYGY